jgi:hypothetical protein
MRFASSWVLVFSLVSRHGACQGTAHTRSLDSPACSAMATAATGAAASLLPSNEHLLNLCREHFAAPEDGRLYHAMRGFLQTSKDMPPLEKARLLESVAELAGAMAKEVTSNEERHRDEGNATGTATSQSTSSSGASDDCNVDSRSAGPAGASSSGGTPSSRSSPTTADSDLFSYPDDPTLDHMSSMYRRAKRLRRLGGKDQNTDDDEQTRRTRIPFSQSDQWPDSSSRFQSLLDGESMGLYHWLDGREG